ncbi:hypothetical protein L2E82_48845 [Cichorium intybus]|uniref:Uncharacterized protein n=1 Tax=Cichorium intybus TaxID=13427 RepID=A0ACB8YZM2_CICIN|nr:hypothetical protein L2E82_48845 [Cichorium intybus]
MSEEALYQSGADSPTAKRKYEDSTAPAPPSSARRVSGFSAAPLSPPGSAPSYNSVPPPMDEIQLAKQRAQEIAARLFNNAEAKRPKFENGGGGFDSNDNRDFSSGPTDLGQKPVYTPSVASSYGYGNPTKKIDIPNGRVGVIIGKAGETIKYLQQQSGAKIQVTRDTDADPHSVTRQVELSGSAESIAHAEQLIKDVLAEAESGGSGIVSRRVSGQTGGGGEQFVMKIPTNKVGLVIGKGGETIKNMQATTGARIQVIPLHPPPGDTSTERTVQIDGTSDEIEAAKQLVNEVISENRQRNPMGGGYSQQQGGYQARPPPATATSWGPPIPQQGYGYTQPYAAYPQQTSGGGGYDYYGQQQTQPPGAPDTSAYSYNQQGQAYGGYTSAPQSGYGYGNPAQTQTQTQTPDDGSQAPPSSAPAPAPAPQSGYNYGYGGYGGPVSQTSGAVQAGYGYSGGYGQPSYPGYGQPQYGGYGGQQPAVYGGGYPQQQSGYSSEVAGQPVPKASPQQN